eukprot:6479155-Amphidinium_carterae.1
MRLELGVQRFSETFKTLTTAHFMNASVYDERRSETQMRHLSKLCNACKELAIAVQVMEMCSANDLVGLPEARKVAAKAAGTISELVIVSILLDKKLQSASRRTKLSARFTKVEEFEKLFHVSIRGDMLEVVCEAARSFISNGNLPELPG